MQLCNFVPHLVLDSIYLEQFNTLFKGDFSNYGGVVDMLYGSSYDPSLYWLWTSSNGYVVLF